MKTLMLTAPSTDASGNGIGPSIRKNVTPSSGGLPAAGESWASRNVAGRAAFPPLQSPLLLLGDGWRPAALTLTLGEPAH